jgi:hypothetical protein
LSFAEGFPTPSPLVFVMHLDTYYSLYEPFKNIALTGLDFGRPGVKSTSANKNQPKVKELERR